MRSRVPTSPRTAVVWGLLVRELQARGATAGVLDAGGGTGVFAVPLAELGYRVAVVDPSPDALAALHRRAAEAGVAELVTGRQGDAETIAEQTPANSADLVLCHNVLEYVEQPTQVIARLSAVLRPSGALSVIVTNRVATTIARALAGQFDTAGRLARSPDGRLPASDGLLRRFDEQQATALVAASGLQVEAVHGVRVVADLVPSSISEADAGSIDALRDLELTLAPMPPYRGIATHLHLLARRP